MTSIVRRPGDIVTTKRPPASAVIGRASTDTTAPAIGARVPASTTVPLTVTVADCANAWSGPA